MERRARRLKTAAALVYLRALHKSIAVPIWVRFAGRRILVCPGAFTPAGTVSASLIARCIRLEGWEEVLEVGCGSGALTVLLAERARRVVAVDVSKKALACTVANLSALGLMEKAEVRLGSLYTPLKPGEVFDVVVSNPPYLPTPMKEGMWGAGLGLELLRDLALGAARHLKPGGRLYASASTLTPAIVLARAMRKAGFDVVVAGAARTPLDTIVVLEGRLRLIPERVPS